MRDEVERAIADHGVESFRVETFRLRSATADLAPPTDPPGYEQYGETQVGKGYYRHVVRYRAHIAPLNEIVRHGAGRPACVR
jgi:hypothetical protein